MATKDGEEERLRSVALQNAQSVLLARRRAEEALRQQSEWLRVTLSSIGDAVISTNAEGRVTFMNGVAESLTGWPQAEALGRPLAAVFRINNQDGRQPAENFVETVLKRGQVAGLANHTVLIAKDGTERMIDDCASPIRDEQGNVAGCVLIFRDITQRRRAEQELADQNAAARLLSAIVDSSDDAIISKTLDGIIQSWNAGAERLFGYTAEQAVGRHISFLFPADRADEEDRIIARLRAGQRVEHFDTVRLRSDGQTVHVSLTISPIKDAAGRVVGASKIARDITERRRADEALRESEERFRMLADNMSQLAWTCDQLGNVTWYNQRWLDYTGLPFEEMQGWGWKAVQHPDHVDRVVKRVEHSRDTGEPWEDTFPLRGKDGNYRWFLSRAVPIRDEQGNLVRWFGTNTDVTEQLAAEDALREADRHKNEFLAMLAHELRNPLAPIRNAVRVLRLTGARGEAVEAASEMLERQVGQMVRLVDDLLDVSRISRGKVELRRERIELASVVNQAVEAARSLVQCMEHDLTVRLPPQPIYLNADATRLAQVLGNLLNNACKFTDKGGRISLTVETANRERERPEVIIRVRDTGIGIAPDHLPRVFDMFMQVDTALERSVSGLGIGLTLVKNLVELHDGTVEVHSTGIGQGSEFVVRLPMLMETAQTPPKPTVSEPALTMPRRILVVDDHRDSAEALALLLHLTGHETRTAHDGLEAVEAAATFKPDVVLLDIGLPKLNGYEACRRVREQPWGKEMVLIALTGWGQEEDRQRSSDAGFNAHMVKPVDLDALMKLLASLPS